MLLDAATRHDIDMRSWFLGDILNDVEADCRAGCRTILIDNSNEIQWQLSPFAIATLYGFADLAAAAQVIISVDITPLIHSLPLVETADE